MPGAGVLERGALGGVASCSSPLAPSPLSFRVALRPAGQGALRSSRRKQAHSRRAVTASERPLTQAVAVDSEQTKLDKAHGGGGKGKAARGGPASNGSANGSAAGGDRSGASSVTSGVRLEGIKKTFKGMELLRDVNWEVKKGERVGLVGVNGAGKTTQLQIITGKMEADGGVVIKAKPNMKIAYLTQVRARRSALLVVQKDCSGAVLRSWLRMTPGSLVDTCQGLECGAQAAHAVALRLSGCPCAL